MEVADELALILEDRARQGGLPVQQIGMLLLCEGCGAEPRHRCVTPSGNYAEIHTSRRNKAREVLMASRLSLYRSVQASEARMAMLEARVSALEAAR